MLLQEQNFYTLNYQSHDESTIESEISLNINHDIYKGHFPQQAVVPGVCMMQILTELTSKALNKNLTIKKANQAKFLIPIVPAKAPSLEVRIKYQNTADQQVKITGSIHAGEITFFKFKGFLA